MSKEPHILDVVSEIAMLAYIAETMTELAFDPANALPITGRHDFLYLPRDQTNATMHAVYVLTNKVRQLLARLDKEDAKR